MQGQMRWIRSRSIVAVVGLGVGLWALIWLELSVKWLIPFFDEFDRRAESLGPRVLAAGKDKTVANTRMAQESIVRRDLELSLILEKVRETTLSAIEKKAIMTIETAPDFVEQDGYKFLVQVATALALRPKPAASTSSDDGAPKKPFNPFCPPETNLYVGHLSDSHMLILNKFNVSPFHMLVITVDVLPQIAGMDETDLFHFWSVVRHANGYGYYNCGPISGASQPHRHAQVIPFSKEAGISGVPFDLFPVIQQKSEHVKFFDVSRNEDGMLTRTDGAGPLCEIRNLPFRHVVIPIRNPESGNYPFGDDDRMNARKLFDSYKRAFSHLHLALGSDAIKAMEENRFASYNILLTPDYMLILPRGHVDFNGIEINGAGLSGSILLRSQEQRQIVADVRVIDILGHIGTPW